MRAPQRISRGRLFAIASTIIALTSTFSALELPAQAAASDTPTVSVAAGNGFMGFTGDGGPAVDASVGSINGLTTDSDGNVSILDSRNKRIRRIDSSLNILSVAGSDDGCTGVFDVSLPLTSFCPANGMAVANDGSFYYSTSSGVEHALKDGTSYHYAGKFTGFYGPYDDGPKFDERISPKDVQIDPSTGIVYFSQQHSVRMITPSGLIQTIAGTPYDCNSGSADSGNAVGACFWVHHFIVRNGDIWFTESSSWNGPRLRYVHDGTFGTIAGNGVWGEPVLNGPAIDSPFQDLNAITMSADGTIYVTPMFFGRIWRITPAGIVESTYEFEGQIDWLTMDKSNNLYVGVDYKHQVMKLSWSQPIIPPKQLSYVALGDSVASGEGALYGWAWDGKKWVGPSTPNPIWEPTSDMSATNQDCHRSSVAYPVLVAAAKNYKLTHLACTGASAVRGILGYQIFNSPATLVQAQLGTLDHSTSPPSLVFQAAMPDVISLTLGADDVLFGDIVERCYTPNTTCDSKAFKKEVQSRLSVQKTNLALVLNEINLEASFLGKHPVVVVTDYYDPFPAQGIDCIDTNAWKKSVGITKNERLLLASWLATLNSNIRSVVLLGAPLYPSIDLRFVELADFGNSTNLLSGHQFCSSDPWAYGPSIRFPSVMGGSGSATNPAPFHPTPLGQIALTNRVLAALS